MRPTVTIGLSFRAYKSLVDYLDRHEADIADKIDDFDDLRPLYVTIYGEAPNGYGPIKEVDA